MNRREYLRRIGVSGTVGVTFLTGCTAPGGESGEETGTALADGAETETVTTAQTEPPAGTETDAATGTETNQTGTETGQNGPGTEPGTGTAAVPNEIAMVTEGDSYYFDPIGLYVEPGETITWRNEAGAHSSTAYTEDNPQSEVRRIPDDTEGWNSGTLSEEGATFTHTFEVTGTYDYYCIPHKTLGMVGRLVVGVPSGFEDDPPDGALPSEQRLVDEGAVSYDAFQSG